jgi:Cu/Zn superoxide dismutase
MKTQLQFLFATLLLLMFSNSIFSQSELPKNPEFTSDFKVIAALNAANEVPTNPSTGIGFATVSFTDSFKTANVQVILNNLTAPITGAHIHLGKSGTTGGVIFNLGDKLLNNKINKSFPISKAQLKNMIDGDYYVNVHTTAYTGGEIRGQLQVDAPESFMVVANGANEVPANESPAKALAAINYYKVSNKIEIKILATDLSGPITGIHFHKGAVGTTGDVVQNLITFLSGKSANGRFNAGNYVEDLRNGGLYLNIHTAMFSGGEVRGQIVKKPGLSFDGWSNGLQENPAINTRAKGLFTGYVNATLDSVFINAITDSLSGAITNAHFHTAALGINGGVAIGLGSTVVGKTFGGTAGFPLSGAQLFNLLRGGLYVNTHTAANSGGEIRGQVYRTAAEGFSFDLCQEQEVNRPLNNPKSIGQAYFSYNRELNDAYLAVYATNLSSALTGAHIHNGAKEMTGPVVLDFGSKFTNSFASFNLDSTFTSALYNIIKLGNGYVNVHTTNNAGGEIRGQIEKTSTCQVILPTKELDSKENLHIYPNPANDIINVVSSNEGSDESYNVIDITGQIVLKSSGKKINISGLKAGMYTLVPSNAERKGSATFVKY